MNSIGAWFVDLSAEVLNKCGGHQEFWHLAEKRLLVQGEIALAVAPIAIPCLRLETSAQYDPAEDEFIAETLYTHSPNNTDGGKDTVRREIKRLIGFLYLRALRTGSRALSLERGSLLDVLLRLQKVRTGLWEASIKRLRALDIEKDAVELQPVLTSIEERLSSYVAATKSGRKTKLYVSQLTREHLRKTMAFFLAMREDQEEVPFQQAGTGTLNTLVLALLSFIAELRPDSVIFAMEEPEIAVQPHTQRRIADYLLQHTKQAFVTSHSPYVIERFTAENTFLLTRGTGGSISSMCVADATGLNDNDYKRYARRGLSECMLGKGVIIVEGTTEFHALPVLARCIEAHDPSLNPLDLAGVIVCAERQKLLACEAHAVVIGGPGSGKTTIALKKAVVRIQAGLLPGQNVLFLSFSRNAVARVLQVARLELSREDRALLHVSTFHAFFWELLKAHGYLLGAPFPLKILMPQDEKVRNGGIRDDDEEWDAWLASRERIFHGEGLIAFDLFAPKAAELLSRGAWIPKLIQQRFPLIIVDEAQDTGPDAWRCIELLAAGSQIICLADLEQQIFDHLPGIGPERLDAIKAALKPTEVDLGSQNLRSPGSQIAEFGQDIIAGRVRPGGYKGVSNMPFSPKADLHATLRTALGCLQKQVHAEKQAWAETIAILVPNAKEAMAVSAALNSGAKPIQHKLMFDEDEARLAARFAAYLLEPREAKPVIKQVEEALSLLHELRRAGGAKGDAARLLKWSVGCKTGKISSAGLVKEVQKLLTTLTTSAFMGDPERDWSSVKASLRASGEALLQTVAGHLDYLVAFNRGKRIGAGLSGIWEQISSYAGARDILDNALAQDLILDGVDDPDGIQVMTIHKAKGKQFDCVIVLRRQRHDGKQVMSNFIWRDDAAPYRRSRKILMVAVTRARVHTMLVQQVWPECPLTRAYTLDSAYK